MCTNLTVHIPRLVTKMTMGAIAASRAFCKYVKHSMASMCTSSIKRTPGTSSAMPWLMYRTALAFNRPAVGFRVNNVAANFHTLLLQRCVDIWIQLELLHSFCCVQSTDDMAHKSLAIT